MKNLERLVTELLTLPNETPWLEFKHNNYNPEMIGKDISALANGAALNDKNYAYMIWGVDDTTHDIVGTEYDLQTLKKGNQELENWLRALLSKNADFEYSSVSISGNKVGVLSIRRAVNSTVMFEKVDYIRIGSYTKRLSDYPSVQARIWEKLRFSDFEKQFALQDLELAEAIRRLNCETYFDLIGLQEPQNIQEIAHYLVEEQILFKQDNGLYAISNLGAILFAKHLDEFPRLKRKAVRIVQYAGKNRLDMNRELNENRGYAVSFEDTIKYLNALLPSSEILENGIRTTKTEYPEVATREAVANALIHQDFSITGAGPVIEIFSNRIEVSNPGAPLVDVFRIVDNPPRSRNETLASLARRLHMCEELGTGWDKMVIACELKHLPAPRIDIYEESTRVTLFEAIKYSEMSQEDRLWACYLHACIKYVQGEQVTNQSIRERFNLNKSSSGSASRLIRDAVEKKLIKPLDPDTAPRYMKYIPIWA